MYDPDLLPDSPAAKFTIGRDHVGLTAASPVRVQRLRVEDDLDPHDHAYVEICVVLAGTGLHRVGGGRRPLAAGEALVMPPGAVHGFAACRGLEVANVYYLGEWLLSDARLLWEAPGVARLFAAPVLFREPPAPRQWRLGEAALAAARREVDDLEAELSADTPEPLLLRATLTKLLAILARSWAEAEPAAAVELPPEVAATIDYAERCLAGGTAFRLEDAAALAGYSTSHFGRAFRRAVGEPPGVYFQRRRVQAAAALLLRPGARLTAVAHRAGYADAAHLVHQFKKHAGTTPAAYRRRHT